MNLRRSISVLRTLFTGHCELRVRVDRAWAYIGFSGVLFFAIDRITANNIHYCFIFGMLALISAINARGIRLVLHKKWLFGAKMQEYNVKVNYLSGCTQFTGWSAMICLCLDFIFASGCSMIHYLAYSGFESHCTILLEDTL